MVDVNNNNNYCAYFELVNLKASISLTLGLNQYSQDHGSEIA